jgi:hypothetical protein
MPCLVGGVSKRWLEKRKKRFFGVVSNQKSRKIEEKTKNYLEKN